jgi:hypothetical protein
MPLKSLLTKSILLYILLVYQFCDAQQPYSFKLPNQLTDVVYNIHQDAKGFMWLATNKGLMRYDGYEYRLFRSDQQTSVAGSNIQEDEYGRLWYQNFDGFLYFIKNDTLESLQQNTPAGFVSYGFTKKHLFVVQKNGVDVYKIDTLEYLKTVNITFDVAESATAFSNNFYFIADNIVYKIDQDFKVTKTDFFQNKKLHIKFIYPYKNSRLYIVSKLNEDKEMYFFDENLKFNYTVPIPEMGYVQGSNIIDDAIWMHSTNGVFVYEKFGKRVYKHALFPENSSSKAIKDHQNNYWFSSINNGINIVPEISHQVFDIDDSDFMRFCKTNDGYLFGTENGEIIATDKSFLNKKVLRSIGEKVPSYYVYFDEKEKQLILSDIGFSIAPFSNLSKGKTFSAALKDVVKIDDKYYGVAISGFGGLLLNPNASKNTTSIWDATFQKFKEKEFPYFSRIVKGVRAKSVDYLPKTNQIAVTTNIGFFIITPNEVKEIKNNNKPVYAETVIAIDNLFYLLDTKGNLYSVSQDFKFKKINATANIPDTYIRLIRKSNDELLIVGSDYIYIFNTITNSIDKIDFHIEAEFINDILKDENELVILTNQDVIKVPITSNKSLENSWFHINSFTINTKITPWKKPLVVSYDQNNVEIKFSILSYFQKPVSAFYRINKQQWIPIHQGTRSISFPSLASGKYTIEFKIGNTVFSDKIQFEIRPPFWKTGWFYLLLTFSISALVFLYFKRQSHIMRRQIRLLNEKVILEKNLSKSVMASIKSQMNPHFFYNALNTIQAYIFTNDKQKANTYLAKFSKLTRLILEMSEKETISLVEEIEALKLYLELEKMRFTDDFEYEIEIATFIDKENIEFPPMLIQPYVENAIKHGLLHQSGDKKLNIAFTQIKNNLKVMITDNGIGRKRSAELNKIKNEKHQSFSTQANEKRLEILNKGKKSKLAVKIVDNFNEFGIATGTTVELTIPVQ